MSQNRHLPTTTVWVDWQPFDDESMSLVTSFYVCWFFYQSPIFPGYIQTLKIWLPKQFFLTIDFKLNLFDNKQELLNVFTIQFTDFILKFGFYLDIDISDINKSL